MFAHSRAVAKCVNVHVSEAVNLGEVQHGQGVVRVVIDAQVAFLVHVIQKVGNMVLGFVPKVGHRVEQGDQGVSEMLGDKRSPEDPGEVVSSREVIVECIDLVPRWWRRDEEVDSSRGIMFMPLIQVLELVQTLANSFNREGSVDERVA